jgi:hypothetical protein
MEVWVDGPRATDQSRATAEQIPLAELPPLTEQEREEARVSGWSDERYARVKFAGEQGAYEWAERVQTLGVLLESMLKQHSPEASLKSILLETFRGRYRATAQLGSREFCFAVREQVAEDLLEAGKAEALDSLRRIVAVAVLPYSAETRVS